MTTKIWKTVTLGKSKEALQKELASFQVGDYAKELLEKMPISQKEVANLVLLTPKDLGFTEYPTTIELFAKAQEQGYDLCPADVGPALRVSYPDQPIGEWLYVAMEPITDSDGDPHVWYVERSSGGSWLSTDWTKPDDRCDLDSLVVFRARKPSDLGPSGIESSDPLTLESAIKICKAAGLTVTKTY